MQKKVFFAFVLGFIMLLSGCSMQFPMDGMSGELSGNLSGNPSGNTGTDNGSVTIDVYAVNDLHGKFSNTETQEGVDELSTFFKQARAENDNTILLSSGDMWQGTAESNLTKGAIITEWMNELDFACMTIGNHEYDWGEDYIESNAELAEFPFLAINIYDSTTQQRVDYCESSVMIEQNGAKIGIIGAIGNYHSSISGDYSKGFYFKTGSELTSLVKTESQRLRQQGADCIIYSIHDGYGSSYDKTQTLSNSQFTYYDVALSQGYVDLVFEAHSHRNYVLTDSKGVYHLQGGGENKGISHAEITVDTGSDSVKVNTAEYISADEYTHLEDDPVVETLLTKYEKEIAKAGKVVGRNDSVRESKELCQLVAQLYYETGVKEWGDKYNIVLGGGFLNVRSPYKLYADEIIYGDLQGILPFDNQLVLCSIKGSDLNDKFFKTTNSNYYIAYGDYGAEVKNNISLNKTYYVVVDTYTSTYKKNNLTEIERYDANVFARDLVAAYIEKGGMQEETIYATISEVLAVGNKLANGETTPANYCVQGKVLSVSDTKYGNMTIQDEAGNKLYIYGTYNQTGAICYDGMTNPPKQGDTVVLCGKIMKYDTKIEMVSGRMQPIA